MGDRFKRMVERGFNIDDLLGLYESVYAEVEDMLSRGMDEEDYKRFVYLSALLGKATARFIKTLKDERLKQVLEQYFWRSSELHREGYSVLDVLSMNLEFLRRLKHGLGESDTRH